MLEVSICSKSSREVYLLLKKKKKNSEIPHLHNLQKIKLSVFNFTNYP